MPENRSQVVDWIVLKVVQRCNLNCTYCYVYNRGDDSWKNRASMLSEQVLEALASRIAEHCRQYALSTFVVELHGGEPLLFGKERTQNLIDVLRSRCAPIKLRFILQTNGLLLDEEWLDLFERNSVSFGISLDGPPELADKYRVYKDGSGSTQQLLDNINRLRISHPHFNKLFGCILCVVNTAINGAELVQWFVDNGFDAFEFLLPDGTYINYPDNWTGAQPYKRFLLEAFDHWYKMGKDAPQIRLFEMMLLGFMGVKPALDALGGDLRKLCVVESDGSIGVSDVVRICRGDYAEDKLNIFEHGFDRHADEYRIDDIQRPCEKCRQCPYLISCGGGYLPHRYDGMSFDNPSIYCEALYSLSERMFDMIKQDMPASLLRDPERLSTPVAVQA